MKRIISVLLTFTLFLSLPVLSGFAANNVIYVSPSGNDSNSGTIDSPLASVKAAKDKAKALGGHLTVYFREGTYSFDSTLNFDSSDGEYVKYKAYGEEKVTFTAAVPYTGFENCTVNGVSALKKDVGKDADFNMLYNDETTLPRTRYPETGYLYVKGMKNIYGVNYNQLSESDRDYALACDAMDVDPDEVPSFKNHEDAVVRILHYWKDEMVGIKNYDSETGHMEFSKVTSMTVKVNDRFFVENVFEALDKPGEWYLDKAEGILYYVPYEGETADNVTLWGSETETLIHISCVDGISFENILFRGNGFSIQEERDFSQAAYDAPACVFAEGCKNFEARNCEFRDLAGCAVFMGSVVTDSIIDSCMFDNIGAQAVYVRGENVKIDSERVSKNIQITNNSISGYGRVYFNAVGILVIHANSVDIFNNEIHDGYYTAISLGWVWGYSDSITYNCGVCDNLIYNIGQGWLSDMGGIYTLGNQPGTVLSGNVIHNVAADPEEGGYGGWGIYLDEGSSFITVEKNLVYACGSDAYHLHYGSTNIVRNNIFALSGESQVRICSAPQRVTSLYGVYDTAKLPAATFTHNIYLTDRNVRVYSHWNNEALSESENIFWSVTEGEDILIGYHSNFNRATGIKTAIRRGYLTDAYVFDPCFKDPSNFEFTFTDSRMAEATGFEPWDYSRAGTLKGSTIGLDTAGGTTAYNAESEIVPETQSKEPLHLFMLWLEKVITWFKAISYLK